VPLITTLFKPSCAAKILATPLFKSVYDDKRIWRVENNGVYSVKSAYRLCVQELLDTSHLKMHGEWKLLWKIQCPPRVKNLLWRISRCCIPTRASLQQKGVNCTTNCALCNNNVEGSYHVFFNCPSSMNVWSICSFHPLIFPAMQNFQDASELIFYLLQQLNADDASLLACVMWSIWKQHNNLV
jgi:hypothetical protein